MKKIKIIICLAMALIVANSVEAQMAAAKTIVWDVQIDVDVNANKGVVWRMLNDNEKLQNHSGGYVKSIRTIDQELVVSKEIVLANGKSRTETIVQTDVVNKFMVIKIDSASLPKGIKTAEIAIFTKAIDDARTNILWVAKIEGKRSKKKLLMNTLKTEFESYAKGFGNIMSQP